MGEDLGQSDDDPTGNRKRPRRTTHKQPKSYTEFPSDDEERSYNLKHGIRNIKRVTHIEEEDENPIENAQDLKNEGKEVKALVGGVIVKEEIDNKASGKKKRLRKQNEDSWNGEGVDGDN
jgi:hypothetical protein